MAKTKKVKRIMHRFRLDEVSSVDVPAQEHARMTLFKRHTPDDADAKEIMAFKDWLAKGASRLATEDPSKVTLLLDGEERTFFAKRDDDEDDDEIEKATDEDDDGDAKPDLWTPENIAMLEHWMGKVKATEQETDTMTIKVTKRPEDFTRKAAEIMKRDGCTQTEAFTTARQEAPEAYAIYKHQPNFAGVDEALAKRARENDMARGARFMTKVHEISKRDGVKHTVAMTTARLEHPDAYAAWQAVS
jgi:hypothetical protein